ncbi:MAG TPA: hypothetical protein DCM86_18530, partial [Verrucomicrobiales bacterium]|nr:hypothetical protein [Verrucomicrobiales bacterium]
MTQPSTPGRSSGTAVGFLVTLALLVVVLGWLFSDSFKPGVTLFSNDAPLGAHTADQVKTPGAFTGVWHDLNWLGANGGSYPADLTFGALYLLGPVGYSKFHAPLALLILGLSAWAMCTALGFRRPVAILTGLAAALNMNAFSNACWGLSCWPLAWAMSFLAVAAVAARTSVLPWVRLALAGLAVGMSVTEGADLGAIFSVTVGAFAFCHTLFSLGNGGKGIGLAVARVGVIGVFAGLMAFHIIDTLVFRAKVLDSVAAQKETMTPEQQWDWATQWSLPKAETLRILIPGLHGYRTDSPDATRYWGTAGRDPHWEMTHQGYSRFSGSGEYAGVLVVLLALFGLASAFRGKGGPLDPVERRMVAFWGAVAVVSLLFAWGRYAPFYRIVHATPYFSSFRNPIKWTQPFHFSVLMLFAFGLQALWRGYIEREPVSPAGFGAWWRKASGFDKNVVVAAGGLPRDCLLFYLLFAPTTSYPVGGMV